MKLESILREAVAQRASDIYILEGKPVTLKVSGRMAALGGPALAAEDCAALVGALYAMGAETGHPHRRPERLSSGDDDFAIELAGAGRFRVNAYRQRQSMASVIRTIPMSIPDPAKLNIPPTIVNLADYQRGIVLFTGTTGSGKSTSLACLIDKINSTREAHIITIEDPIEYRHEHKKGIISQRELNADTQSYVAALRAAMRQVPDVILVGEMRDHETITAAITAAETGHLVFSTLHTIGAAATIDRIIDVFPPNQQNQIRAQLSIALQAVVSQQLIPTLDGKLHPAYEIMIVNNAIRNLIRENKVFQIENIIQTSVSSGMKTMDMSIYELFRQRVISKENALLYSVSPQIMSGRLSGQLR